MTADQQPDLGVVIVAAGSGQRFGNGAKVLTPLAGKSVLSYSLELFGSLSEVREIVVVAGTHTIEPVRKVVAAAAMPQVRVCLGGETRSDSVRNGIATLSAGIDLVAVHDAARPLVTSDLVHRVLAAAREHGAAIPVTPVNETIYRVGDDNSCADVVPRIALRAAQTPQVARREWLERALSDASGTDEGTALMACGYRVWTVEGCVENIKLTWPGDLRLAEAIAGGRAI